MELEPISANVDPEIISFLDRLGGDRNLTIRKALWYYYRAVLAYERDQQLQEQMRDLENPLL